MKTTTLLYLIDIVALLTTQFAWLRPADPSPTRVSSA